MNFRRGLLLVALAVAVAVAGCTSAGGPGGSSAGPTPTVGPTPTAAPSSAAPDLDGRAFLSTSVTENGSNRPLVPNTRIRIGFTGGQLSANAGCNTMGAAFSIDSGRLVAGSLVTTDMGCDAPRHDQDTWLATFLGSRPNLQLTGTSLALEGGSTVISLVDRRIAEPDQPLIGPTWTVDTVIGGDSASSIAGGVVATLTFSADGRVRVETGCNTGAGSYVVDEAASTVRFSAIALTKRACQGPGGQLEQDVLAVLGGEGAPVTFRIQASRLTLTAGPHGLGLQGAATTP